MTTQFGGGKTHSLLLLYHLASHGEAARDWQGVSRLRELAGVKMLPEAKVAVFVGTEFDPISGRGGATARRFVRRLGEKSHISWAAMQPWRFSRSMSNNASPPVAMSFENFCHEISPS